MSINRLSKSNLRYANDKQRGVMEVILRKFGEYERTNRPHYKLNGMASSHVVEKVLEADSNLVLSYWPQGEQQHNTSYGTILPLTGDSMRRLHNNVRAELDRLAKRGYLEKVGNVNERRWLPHQDLLREIAQDYGHSSK